MKDKAAACKEIMRKKMVVSGETIFVGDDTIDLPAFAVCGITYAVSDAPAYVKKNATGILTSRGGEGAFRELAEIVLKAKGKARVYETGEVFSRAIKNIAQ